MVIMQEILHSYIVDEKSIECLAEKYNYSLAELENIAEMGKWPYRRDLFKENINGK
jgi:hypothetical protein